MDVQLDVFLYIKKFTLCFCHNIPQQIDQINDRFDRFGHTKIWPGSKVVVIHWATTLVSVCVCKRNNFLIRKHILVELKLATKGNKRFPNFPAQ